MIRKNFALLLALLLLCQTAFAEIYVGSTIAGSVENIEAEAEGMLDILYVCEGQRIAEGDVIGQTRLNRVFAAENGTISLIHGENGGEIEGAVLELAPEKRYTVYSTVGEAYESAENMLVHMGETLYMRCTTNGTHRAIGLVSSIDGGEYHVETIGGELYIGETVYLYREDDFESEDRVGIGTVVPTENQTYEINGTLVELCVEDGEYVERGELLFTWASEKENWVIAECAGIITTLQAEVGDRLASGQTVAQIAPEEDILIEIEVDEAEISDISVGDRAYFVLAGEDDDQECTGSVCGIYAGDSDGAYSVRIRPDRALEYIGRSVEVLVGE